MIQSIPKIKHKPIEQVEQLKQYMYNKTSTSTKIIHLYRYQAISSYLMA